MGIATPTEAAGTGSLGAIISAAIYRRLNWKMIKEAAIRTMRITCMLIWLFFGASAIIGYYTLAGGTDFVTQGLIGLKLGPIGTLIVMQVIWVILGCFLDWIGILLLTIPLFLPIIREFGFDPVWIGVLYCLNMQISYISPPFGPGVFYLKAVTPEGITVGQIFRSPVPFFFLILLALVLNNIFPQIALWLPGTMIK